MLLDQVAAIIRDVGTAEVVSRFRALTEGDIDEKSPGDLVTIADQECERVLTERLRHIRAVPVVGEEATASDPTLLDLVATAPAAWIVDPIDGTANFVAGNTNYAVMVALVEMGVTQAAWIWHPDTDTMLAAERGKGIFRNGERVAAISPNEPVVGIMKRWYVPEPGRTNLADVPGDLGDEIGTLKSAGIEYAALVDGTIDFLFYWRTLPWDHAPGALLVEEAGLRVGRPDGSEYRPGDGRDGLLVALPELWGQLAAKVQLAIAIDR